METAGETTFYKQLPEHLLTISDLLKSPDLMVAVPDSWHVVITDIRGSTQAVNEGRHEEVNLVATGSIVTVLNISIGLGIQIPFFFGGDGATFMVPNIIIDPVMESLIGFRMQVLEKFGLNLRAGSVPVAEVYRAKQVIKIAKYRNTENFAIPVVTGHGLAFAETEIKNSIDHDNADHFIARTPNLHGMQCRWDKISPPAGNPEIVTLLVSCKNLEAQNTVFADILSKIEELFGTFDSRQPITVAGLKLKSTFKQLRTDIKHMKTSKWRAFINTWLNSLYGRVYFKTSSGRAYLVRIVEMSDTLVIDGRINTVISGTVSKRKDLLQFLDVLEYKGLIVYGSHISSASIMSCYVQNPEYGHIHFVDGAEGGYTHAASILKRKLRYSPEHD
jgi:hypothetical protein